MEKIMILVKTATWRVAATTTTILLIYFFTGEIKLATSAALVEMVVKTIVYYLHEVAWDKISDKIIIY